jgi:hypothetical protein
MRYEIEVLGLPPKKDGANSMWAKQSEIPRLIALRRAVANAFAGESPLSRHVRLELEVHLPGSNPRFSGDLDNQITGICDGLMAADPRIKAHPAWLTAECVGIEPNLGLGIEDDSQVDEIRARRLFDATEPWYRLVLEGERAREA